MQYQNWIDVSGVRWEATTVYHYDALGNRIHEIRVEENYTDLLLPIRCVVAVTHVENKPLKKHGMLITKS